MHSPSIHGTLLRVLLPDEKNLVESIPGVRVDGRKVRASYHAAPFLDEVLRRIGVRVPDARFDGSLPQRVSWEEVCAYLMTCGEVDPQYLDDYALPFQKDALGFAAAKPGAIFHHPTGAGKTYQEILWSLCAPSSVLVLTKNSVKIQFARAVEKYTKLRAFALRPKQQRRKRAPWKDDLAAYMAWCAEAGQRPFVVASIESIEHYTGEIYLHPWHNLVVDEVQLAKSWKRWKTWTIPKDDLLKEEHKERIAEGIKAGGFIKVDNGRRKLITPTTNRTGVISGLAKGAQRRLVASATVAEDRIRDLFSPLTIAEPWAWGSWTTWSQRYTDAKPSPWNAKAIDTTGLSNASELVQRMSWIMHKVEASVVRAQLPGMRRETLYVEMADQAEIPKAEAKKFQADLKAAKTSGARMEVEIAIGTARCLPATVERVVDHLQSGDKVTLFTVRRWMSEAVVKAVRKALKGKYKDIPVLLADGNASERDAMVQEYASTEGAAFIVGTGAALGTGTDDLQCTNAAFFLGVPYSPGVLEQWEGRFPRLGQSAPVIIYYVVGEGTAMEHFAEVALAKLPAIAEVASSGALRGVSTYLAGIGDPEELAAGIIAKLAAVPDEDADWD